MPNSEAQRDLRTARILLWWEKNNAIFLVTGLIFCGMFIGGYAMSFYDREERMALMRRHDDDIRDMRIQCRTRVDERDLKVQEATGAATAAAVAVQQLTEAAAGDPPRPVVLAPPAKPPVKRAPPVNLEEAVTRANAQIQQGRK